MGFIAIFHLREINLSWKVVENHRGIVLKQWKRSKYVCFQLTFGDGFPFLHDSCCFLFVH